MKKLEISEGFAGLSAASILIGLSLFGLCLGNAMSTGIAMWEHMLFLPSIVCIGGGVLNLMLLLLSDFRQPKNKNS